MELIILVLPLGLLLGGVALAACVASIRGGQFDDLETPPIRALLDDLPVRERPADPDADPDAD